MLTKVKRRIFLICCGVIKASEWMISGAIRGLSLRQRNPVAPRSGLPTAIEVKKGGKKEDKRRIKGGKKEEKKERKKTERNSCINFFKLIQSISVFSSFFFFACP